MEQQDRVMRKKDRERDRKEGVGGDEGAGGVGKEREEGGDGWREGGRG